MQRKVTIFSFTGALIGFFTGMYISQFYQCGYSSSCSYLINRVGDPMFYGMGALALIFLVLLFVPRAFSWWWKFAIVFIPIAAFIFIAAPEPQGWVSPIPAPEQVYQWVSVLYVVLSLAIIIAATWWKGRRGV